jgi:hypothetical protein
MKAVVLFLLLANLLFLAWTQWLAPDDDPGTPARAASDLPTLQLAGENAEPGAGAAAADSDSVAETGPVAPDDETAIDPASPEAAENPAAGPAELLAGVARCVSIGSFRTLAEATQASATLRTAGHEPRTRVAEGDVWAGLWVSMGNLASRTEAQRISNLLKQRGIGDAYVMPAGNGANEISLGIFSDPARAQRRADDVKALGFTPTISDRTRRGTVYWIDVDLEPTDGFIDPATLQAESGKIVRLEVQACTGDEAAG